MPHSVLFFFEHAMALLCSSMLPGIHPLAPCARCTQESEPAASQTQQLQLPRSSAAISKPAAVCAAATMEWCCLSKSSHRPASTWVDSWICSRLVKQHRLRHLCRGHASFQVSHAYVRKVDQLHSCPSFCIVSAPIPQCLVWQQLGSSHGPAAWKLCGDSTHTGLRTVAGWREYNQQLHWPAHSPMTA